MALFKKKEENTKSDEVISAEFIPKRPGHKLQAKNQAEEIAAQLDTPKDTNGPEIKPIDPKRFYRHENFKKYLVVGIVALLVFGGVISFFLFKDDAPVATDTQPIEAESMFNIDSTEYLPRFENITGKVEHDGFTWISTTAGLFKYNDELFKSYSLKENLPSLNITSLVSDGTDLWAGFHGGVAKLQKESDDFKLYLNNEENGGPSTGVLNTNIYFDSVDKKIIVTSFKGYYEYNSGSDKFDKIDEGPINTSSLVFTDTHRVAINKESNDGAEVLVYDRSSEEWSANNPSDYTASDFTIVKVGQKPLAFGRSSGYGSCANKDKEAATVFYEFNGSKWISVKALDEKFFSNELNNVPRLDLTQVVAKTASCKEGEDSKEYKLVIQDGDIVATDEKILSPENGREPEDSEQKAIKDDLQTKFKLQPGVTIKGVDADGTLFTSIAKRRYTSDYGLATFSSAFDKSNDLTDSLDLDEHKLMPISCNDQNRTIKALFFGQENQLSGGWVNASLYKYEGNSIAKIIDLDNKTTPQEPAFTCDVESIYWAEDQSIKKVDFTGSAISEVVKIDKVNGPKSTQDSSGKLWIQPNSGSVSVLQVFDPATGKVEKVTLSKKQNIKLGGSQTLIHDDKIWISNSVLAVYDLQGKYLGDVEGANQAILSEAGEGKIFIVNPADINTYDAEFLFVDSSTLRTSELNTEFIYTRDVKSDSNLVFDRTRNSIWLSGSNYGIVKVPISE